MKVIISQNRVVELTAAQLFELFQRQFNPQGGIRSITVRGRTANGEIGTVEIVDNYTTEVRWSEEAEEREI